jgi:hypothetical protein
MRSPRPVNVNVRQMREPMIIEADDGFHFIATRSYAEVSLEAIDINNGEYRCYDADGFKLDLAPAPNGAGLISSPNVPVDCRSELEEKLRQFFVRVGVPDSEMLGAGFSELVQIGIERFLEHPPKPLSDRFWAAGRGFFGAKNTA